MTTEQPTAAAKEQPTAAAKEQPIAAAREQTTAAGDGGACAQCGSAMAADQRYCLNCGWRRGNARVDYENQVLRGQPPTAGAPVATTATNSPQWSPLFAIGAIALLGVFLLLGVLIGKNDDNGTQTVAAQAAPTTTAAAAAPTPTTASAAPKANKNQGGGNKTASAATAPGQGDVVQGGSGSAAGIQAANPNASPQENAKNGPDVVATQGAPAKLDPNGQAGGGSGATCIGC